MNQSQKVKKDIQALSQQEIMTKLSELYTSEFIDECQEIITKKETDFLRDFFRKMNLIVQEEFGQEAFDDYTFSKAKKETERKVYETLYSVMKNNCLNAWLNYIKLDNKAKENTLYLRHFIPHCSNNTIPVHTCKGRFIPVYDSKNKIIYVICSLCKFCYFDHSILMHCSHCKQNIYSAVLLFNDKTLSAATWEKYHCNAVMNEQMHCIKCQYLFYLMNDQLLCKHCKFIINPLEVLWKCIICKKDFRSKAKIYNPLEFKVYKIAIKNALLYKVLVKPRELPCNCKVGDPTKLVFYHKSNCKGLLLEGRLNGNSIIVCSKCKTTGYLNKFQWNCPACLKAFKTTNVKYINTSEDESVNVLVNKHSNQLSENVTDKISVEKRNFQEAISYIRCITDTNRSILTSTDEKINKIRNSTSATKSSVINTKIKEQPPQKRNLSNYKDKEAPHNRYYTFDNDNALNNPAENDNKSDLYSSIKKSTNNDCNRLKHEAFPSIENVMEPPLTSKPIANTESSRKEDISSVFKCNFNNYKGNIPKKAMSLMVNQKLDNQKSILSTLNQKEANPLSMSGESFSRFKNFSKKAPHEETTEICRDLNEDFLNEKWKSGNVIEKLRNESTKEIELGKKNESKILKTSNVKGALLVSKSAHGFSDFKTKDASYNTPVIIKAKPDDYKAKESSDESDDKTISNNNNEESCNEKANALQLINVEDYSIITQLGQGSFGKIYLVQDKHHNLFSLKKIILNEELDINLILEEYQLCHSLKHDNIIKILGYSLTKFDSNTFGVYILMEVGMSDWEKEIKTHIDKKHHYSEKEILNILFQLVSALAFLQNQNVSHRDIKPQNVLVFKSSLYKLADFGEAKQIDKEGRNNILSTLRGTELYMSPLLYNGLKTNQIDIKHNLFKSDVFSLGLCIVFAMTLTSDSIYEIRKMTDSNSIKTYLKKVAKGRYSRKLLEFIGEMLEINEKDRDDCITLEIKLSSQFLRNE